jgi:hypothetical protein
MRLHTYRDEDHSRHFDLISGGKHPRSIDLVVILTSILLVVGAACALIAVVDASGTVGLARIRAMTGQPLSRPPGKTGAPPPAPIRFIRGIGQAYRLKASSGSKPQRRRSRQGHLGDDCADRQEPISRFVSLSMGTPNAPGPGSFRAGCGTGSSAPGCRLGSRAAPPCTRAPRSRRTPLYLRRGRASAAT